VVPLVAPVESNAPHRHLRVALPDFPADAAVVRFNLRRTLRLRRASVPSAARTAAVQRITRHIATSDWLRSGLTVGLYTALADEVPTAALMRMARQRRCLLFFPRIIDYRQRRMVFAPDPANGRWCRNRYGIPEPVTHHAVPAYSLGIVFVPVLGFDAGGTRLGYGGGYYDRAFAFRHLWPSRHRPLLAGIAFGCQQLPHIDRYAHDVALDAVVTEDGITYFKSRGSRA